jgi:ABC-type multidrug transport system ATPase subunit
LKEPELLILDEPTNGLDPAGMAEMRPLIRGLGKGGRTVLLSSHLMNEVEQICDRVGIVRKGRLVAEGTVEDLRAEDALRVRVEPVDEARRVILAMNGVGEVTVRDGSLRIATDPARSAAINRALVNAGLNVSEVCVERSSLEDVFLELTQESEAAT